MRKKRKTFTELMGVEITMLNDTVLVTRDPNKPTLFPLFQGYGTYNEGFELFYVVGTLCNVLAYATGVLYLRTKVYDRARKVMGVVLTPYTAEIDLTIPVPPIEYERSFIRIMNTEIKYFLEHQHRIDALWVGEGILEDWQANVRIVDAQKKNPNQYADESEWKKKYGYRTLKSES